MACLVGMLTHLGMEFYEKNDQELSPQPNMPLIYIEEWSIANYLSW